MGYAAATLEDIAEEVGINRASLYYYVGTKAELLIEILHQPIFDMTTRLRVIHDSDANPREKLRLAIASHMEALDQSYPELFVFLADHLHVLTEGDPEGDVVANARRYGDLFTDIVREGQKAGVIRKEIHPRIAMMGVVGMCNWTHRWYREDGQLSLSEIGDDFALLALDGLCIREAGKAPPRQRSRSGGVKGRGNGR